MANGDFTSAVILDTQLKLEQGAANAKLSNVWRIYSNPKHKTLLALLQNQANTFDTMSDKNKDYGVTVHWIEKTSVSAASCNTDCSWTGTAAGTYAEEYDLDSCIEAKFSYSSATWRTSQYDEAEYRATQFLQHCYAIVESLNTSAIAFLEANFGVNAFPESFTVNGSDETEVPAAVLTPSLWAYFSGVKEVNDMSNAFIVSGSALYSTEWLAMTETDQAGVRRIDTTPIYFDLKGLASDADKPTWLVDPASYVVASKSKYEAAPMTDRLNRTMYSIACPFGTGLNYDVIELPVCATDEEITTHVKIKARVGFFLNPVSVVSTDNKGILKYVTV